MIHVVEYPNKTASIKPLFVSWMCDVFSADIYVEVGLWRMQTFGYLNSKLNSDVEMIGFDLFDNSPLYESEIVPDGVGFSYSKCKEIVSKWDRKVSLIEGDTKETLSKDWLEKKDSRVVVFLDGGHSYETVKSDFWNLYNTLTNGIIIMDDWIDPSVFGGIVSKYGLDFTYSNNNAENYRFWDGTWKFAKELHDDPNVCVTYVGDVFHDDYELEYLGLVSV